MRNSSRFCFRYFSFDRFCGLSILAQCLGVIFLIILSVFIGLLDVRSTGLHFGYTFSPTIFFAPLYEELLFRGLLLGFLMTRTTPSRAVFLTSLLFGFWHFKNALWMPVQPVLFQVLYAFVLGLLLSFSTLRHQSIVPAVILHFLNNIIAESLRML